MSDTLIFYTHPMSRGRIVRWMLEETGAPYSTELLEFGSTMKSSHYRAINPMGKVPALRHGQTIVTECAAICAYLADAFPAAGLAPPLHSRGEYYRWLFFAAGPLESAVTHRALGLIPPVDQQGMVGYGSFAAVMDTLEHAVERSTYLTGDHFTAADVYVGSQIGWGLRFNTIEPRPGFAAYWSRVGDREAYRRANALDDAALATRADRTAAQPSLATKRRA